MHSFSPLACKANFCQCIQSEGLCTYVHIVRLLSTISVYKTTSLNNQPQMTSTWTAHIYGPVTWNTDQTRFKSIMSIHIHHMHFRKQNLLCEQCCCVNTTPPFESSFWVGPLFLIWFDSVFLIWIIIYKLTQIIWFYLANFCLWIQSEGLCTYVQTIRLLNTISFSQTTSINNQSQMTSPWTAHIYDPVIWNTNQKRFKSIMSIHIHHMHFRKQN